MMKGYIYAIKENGKIIYIGSTTNIERRKWQHFKECRTHKMQPIHRHMRANNNIGFSIDTIFEGDFESRKDLIATELRYVKKFNTSNDGFNVDDGERRGELNANSRKVACKNDGKEFNTVTEASLFYGIDNGELASHLTRKRYLNGIGLRKFGEALFFEYVGRECDSRLLKQETKDKVRNVLIKRNSKKVYCKNTNKVYNTIKEAAVDLNVNYSTLSQHIKGSKNHNNMKHIEIYYIENV